VRDAVAPARLKLQVKTTDVSGPCFHSFPRPSTPAVLASLESNIVKAVRENRVRLRQLNADYSGTGQGRITGW
jgi:hypothetical protein